LFFEEFDLFFIELLHFFRKGIEDAVIDAYGSLQLSMVVKHMFLVKGQKVFWFHLKDLRHFQQALYADVCLLTFYLCIGRLAELQAIGHFLGFDVFEFSDLADFRTYLHSVCLIYRI